MSFDTSTTSRFVCISFSARTTPEYLVIRLACGQAVRRACPSRPAFEKSGGPQLPCCRARIERIPSSIGVFVAATNESSVRETWRALRATSDMPFLWRIELLQSHHRQEHVVFFESEQARRVVQQHVGIENEQPRRTGRSQFLRDVLSGLRFGIQRRASRAAGLGRRRRRLRCLRRARDRRSGTTAGCWTLRVRCLAAGSNGNRGKNGSGLGRCFRKWHQRDDRSIRGNIEGQTSCE